MTDKGRQQAVAEAIWQTMVLAYREPGDRSLTTTPIPVREACGALMTCMVNILSQTDDAQLRQDIMRQVGPVLDRGVTQARARETLILPGDGVELPN